MNQRNFETAYGLRLTGCEPRTLRDYCRFLGVGGHEEFVPAGRGPGNGVRATAYGVAKLCLSVWFDVPAYRAAEAHGPLFCIPVADSPQADEANMMGFSGEPAAIDGMTLGVCPLTKVCTLGEALCALFTSPQLADTVSHVTVRRGSHEAIIFARDGRVSRFCTDADAMALDERDARGEARRLTVIGGAVIGEAARALQGDK